MGSKKNLPEDFAIDAMALEAERRGKAMGRAYSYGKLMADTSKEEREEILRAYRVGGRKRSSSTKSAFLAEDRDAEEETRRKLQPAEEEKL